MAGTGSTCCCEAAGPGAAVSYEWASGHTLCQHDHVSHDDNRRRLNGKFAGANRYANFGPLLQSLEIRGFRGINDLTLTVQSPITALSGLNGTGKSTIAQLASCGYRKASTATLPRYYVRISSQCPRLTPNRSPRKGKSSTHIVSSVARTLSRSP
jgi:hypothetical protein